MALARMRTINQAASYFKERDPATALGAWNIRQLILSKKVKCHKSNSRYLINLDLLEEYLANPPEEETLVEEYGTLRKVQQAGRR